MAIRYQDRPEMMMTSKVVRELYFAALDMVEAMEREGANPVEPVADALNRLIVAIETFQGKELSSADNDKD